jgi:porphobilinogen synthase
MKTNSNFRNVGFPTVRLRRLRRSPAIRDILQETRLSVKDLICPIFVKEGIEKPQTVESMPAIQRIPISKLIKNIEAITDLGIRAILLFGIPLHKDDNASSASDDKGIVQQSTEIIRKHFGDNIAILTDVCLCQYSSHGHCGIIKNQRVDNDNTIITLRKVAISHARVGADFVAPSAMMDGQVKAIREGLDNAGYSDTGIIGYSAKHASPLYAPFRDVAHSVPNFGDRRSYQMPTSNAREASREIEFDINEGVDIIMIKPAIPYLDLIYQAKTTTTLPICAYSVSGEYALIKAAADEGWIDENAVMSEFMISIKRAGANMIITYYAKQMAELLNEC